MLLRDRQTNKVITDNEFRSLHSDTSFPVILTPEILNDFGVDPVLPAPQPTPGEFETVVMDGTIQDSKGNWIENWVVRPMFSDYKDANNKVVKASTQQAAYVASKLEEKRRSMVVSPLQASIALHNAGLLDAVETYINNPSTDATTKLAWNKATEFRRLSPMISTIASVLNITDTQLDNLFEEAAKIVV